MISRLNTSLCCVQLYVALWCCFLCMGRFPLQARLVLARHTQWGQHGHQRRTTRVSFPVSWMSCSHVWSLSQTQTLQSKSALWKSTRCTPHAVAVGSSKPISSGCTVLAAPATGPAMALDNITAADDPQPTGSERPVRPHSSATTV